MSNQVMWYTMAHNNLNILQKNSQNLKILIRMKICICKIQQFIYGAIFLPIKNLFKRIKSIFEISAYFYVLNKIFIQEFFLQI